MGKFSNPPNQSKGILDDYAVRKNIATREGTVEKVPVNDSDIINKKHFDDNTYWEYDGSTLEPKTTLNVDTVALRGDITGASLDVNSGSIDGGDITAQGALEGFDCLADNWYSQTNSVQWGDASSGDGTFVFQNNVTIGTGATGVDYTLTFNGESDDCVITYDEDNNILNFGDTEIETSDKGNFGGIAGVKLGSGGFKADTNDRAMRIEEFNGTEIWTWNVNSDGDMAFENSGTGNEPFRIIDSDNSIRLGLTTNYSEFENDGTLVFNGNATVWNDANLGGAVLQLAQAGNPGKDEFKDEGGNDTGITTYAFSVGEYVCGSLEIPHDYKEGTDIYFHVHWQGHAAPTGTDKVKWQLIYTVGQTNETLDAATTITKETDIDTQYDFKLSDFAAITGTNFNIGDQFLFQIGRVAASADEYGGEALIATVGIHYECDTAGSRQITTK